MKGFRYLPTIFLMTFALTAGMFSFEIVGYVPYYRLPPPSPSFVNSAFNWASHSPEVVEQAGTATANSKAPFLEYLATQIFEKKITQINYFSVKPSRDGRIQWAGAQALHLDILNRLRTVSSFRLVLTVSGTANDFVPMLASPQRRQRFLAELQDLVSRWQLDGIDFDWEFPRHDQDLAKYIKLLEEARQTLGEETTLSVAIARQQLLNKKLFDTVDRVHLMAYDFSGKHSTFESASEMVAFLRERFQIPASKLLLGIPLYARVYSLKSNNYRQAMAYYHLVQQYSPSPEKTEVEGYYFNNYDTVQRKIHLAREQDLAGVMFWELGQDLYDNRSIIRQIIR